MLLFSLSCFVLSGDSYDSLGQACYVDSANGNDGNNGLTESTPKKTVAAIPSSAVVVRFKRGTEYHGRLNIPSNTQVKVYTNYGDKNAPLPHFIVSHDPGQGPVIITFVSNLTFDGLHLSGARGDNTMVHDFTPDANGKIDGIVGGLGTFLAGSNTKFLNGEIDDCDIGLMIAGQQTLIRGNYVHDLIMGIDEDPGVDPNLVGGAEGIFVNAANVEVCYNNFVNCTGPARWVGGYVDCDGGAVEISAQATNDSSLDIYNVRFHHNYACNCCGFFEAASYFDPNNQNTKGTIRDTYLYDNVIVDSGWMGLMQVNNTNFRNIQFNNNTLIQRPGTRNPGMLWSVFTATSSGMTGGDVVPGTMFLTNNLYVLDGVQIREPFGIHPNMDQKNNIVRIYGSRTASDYNDLGFANIAGTAAEDFDIIKITSPAVDKGVAVGTMALDFLDRSRPNGSAPDIGAFEYYGGSSASKGDVNGSGSIDIVDALLIAQYYVGLNPANFNSAAADANCSGSVDIVDALRIAQFYVGLISSLNC